MKMNKNELKELIKECIIEVLEDGLVSSNRHLAERVERPQRSKRQPLTPAQMPRRGEFVSFGQARTKQPQPVVDSSNPFAAIFEDTARTTLKYQEKGTDAVVAQGDTASRIISETDDISSLPIFSDSADRWAAVAFQNFKEPSEKK